MIVPAALVAAVSKGVAKIFKHPPRSLLNQAPYHIPFLISRSRVILVTVNRIWLTSESC